MVSLKISALLLLLAICISDSFSQTVTLKSGSKPGYEYWDETVLRFKTAGMTSLNKSAHESTNDLGYGGTMTLQFPISRPVSLYAELIIGAGKFKRWESENGVSYLKSDKVEPILFSQAGVRLYPSRADFPLYLKTGIALPYVIFPLPILTTGAGYDFIISDKIGIYPEVELLANLLWKGTAIVFGLGLELFH